MSKNKSVNKEYGFSFNPYVNVYYSRIPKHLKIKNVYPDIRNKHINDGQTKEVKKQRYIAWKLLEYAFKHTYDVDIKQLNFTQQENGKWISDHYKFSITHTKKVVAVAVFANDIGIDLEEAKVFKDGIENKILTGNELDLYKKDKNNNNFLCEYWVKKESIFKYSNESTFIPNEIEAKNFNTNVIKLNVRKTNNLLSVCTDKNIQINLFKIKNSRF